MGELTTKFIFNRSGRLDILGNGIIQLRITFDKKSKFISTGIRVNPKQWDSSKERVKSHPDVINLNLILSSIREKALVFHRDCILNGKPSDVSKIAEYLRTGTVKTDSANQFFRALFESKDGERNTLKQHRLMLNYLDKFNKDISFHEIDYSFVKSFEGWLSVQDNYRGGKLSKNYVSSLLRTLRVYTNEAIKHRKLEINPFLGFRIRSEDKDISHLTLREVEIIENLDVSHRKGYIPETKEMFLFACYTSLRFSDLCTLRVKHLKQTPNGLVLEKKPQKTKKAKARHKMNLSKLFWGKPAEIVKERIEGKEDNRFVFGPHHPDNYNNSYNTHLKIIAEMAGLDKKVTSHVARHTCAMVLLNEFNFSIEDVSTIMAHSDISITQKYARVRYDRLDRAIEEKFKSDEQRH